ncbi:MAG: hypothetical protein ABSG25_00110 [Bryobacteraceae bacterium]|jgi:mRNA-degrading endonuclease RelE of RelBE toxin-antitoxin system
MTLAFSPRFVRSYRKAPATVQQAFDKQSALLLENLRHPSLRAKKYGISRQRKKAWTGQEACPTGCAKY